MRNPNRIHYIMKRIEEIWEKYPDLRLGQLIGNVIDVNYLYEIEDKKLIELMEKTYDT
jgi:hypothetical protein